MRRETQNILLVLLGGALLKIAVNGSFLRYVKPSHQPWLIAAGAAMLALAAVSILRDVLAARRSQSVAVGAGGQDTAFLDDTHGHQHQSHSAWLLLLPVLAVFLIAPPSLGSDSVTRADGRGNPSERIAAGNAAMFPPLEPTGVLSMRMSDFASRSAWDSANSLNGRTVRLVGFVVNQGETTYLARMAIACCAADAFPVKVKMTGEGLPPVLANDTWVEVDATLQAGTATQSSQYVPTVTVTGLRSIQEPTDPYEF